MTRDDTHTDAMLRHLGAAYYESLHGRASAADVARARAAIEERLAEEPGATGQPVAGHRPGGQARRLPHHHGRFHSTVRDVMTTDVVTVDRITPYKEIARLLAGHRISAVPVLVMGRHVAGVVSEDDLLTARDTAARRAQTRQDRAPALDPPPGQPASEAHGGRDHVLAGDHDPPGCAHPPGGPAAARSPHQAAARDRPRRQADRHRQPA